MQEFFDSFCAEFRAGVIMVEAKVQHHVPELFLVENAVTIYVDTFVDLSKVGEEFFMLF